ncbi:MAG: FHA domain-containing protein [Myxococcota bacterium]
MATASGWRIISVGGTSNGVEYLFAEQGITLGRSDECEVALASQNVSRKHARFFVYQDIPYVQDAGSRNGVFVNGVRIQQQALANGDTISLGEFTFRLSDGSVTVEAVGGKDRKPLLVGGTIAVAAVLVIVIAAVGGKSTPAVPEVAPIAEPAPSGMKSLFEKPANSGAATNAGGGNASSQGGNQPQAAAPAPVDERKNVVREYLDRAELLQGAGKYHEAREQYERALKIDPGCQLCLTRRERLMRDIDAMVKKHLDDGMKAFQSLRYEDAVSSWELVVNLVPDQNHPIHQQALKNIRDAQAKLNGQPGY